MKPSDVTLHIKGDVKRLRLQEGDAIFVKLDDARYLSSQERQNLAEGLKELFPGHRVVFSDGLDIAVVSEDDAA